MANLRGLNTASGGYALSSQKRGADRLSSAPLSVAGRTTPPGAGHLPDRCKGPLAQSPLFLYAVFSSVSSSYSYSDGWPGLFSSSSSGSPSAVFSSSFSSSSLSFSIFISVFPAFSSIFVSFFSFCLSFSFSSSPMPAPRPHAPVRATARATRIAPIASLERLESSTLLLKKPLSFLLWPHRTAKPNGPGSASIRLRWPDEPPLLARGAYPIGATRSLAQSPLLPYVFPSSFSFFTTSPFSSSFCCFSTSPSLSPCPLPSPCSLSPPLHLPPSSPASRLSLSPSSVSPSLSPPPSPLCRCRMRRSGPRPGPRGSPLSLASNASKARPSYSKNHSPFFCGRTGRPSRTVPGPPRSGFGVRTNHPSWRGAPIRSVQRVPWPKAPFSLYFSFSPSIFFSIFISVFPSSGTFTFVFTFSVSVTGGTSLVTLTFVVSVSVPPPPHALVRRATARATRIAPIASLERLESSTLLLKKPLSFLLWPHRTAKPNGPGSASIRLRWPDEPPLLARGAYPVGATGPWRKAPFYLTSLPPSPIPSPSPPPSHPRTPLPPLASLLPPSPSPSPPPLSPSLPLSPSSPASRLSLSPSSHSSSLSPFLLCCRRMRRSGPRPGPRGSPLSLASNASKARPS